MNIPTARSVGHQSDQTILAHKRSSCISLEINKNFENHLFVTDPNCISCLASVGAHTADRIIGLKIEDTFTVFISDNFQGPNIQSFWLANGSYIC